MTRSRTFAVAVVVAVVAAALGASAGAWAAGAFEDVSAESPHARAIEWAAAHGIVMGKTPGQFDPDAPLTRAQMATVLYRYHHRCVAWPHPWPSKPTEAWPPDKCVDRCFHLPRGQDSGACPPPWRDAPTDGD